MRGALARDGPGRRGSGRREGEEVAQPGLDVAAPAAGDGKCLIKPRPAPAGHTPGGAALSAGRSQPPRSACASRAHPRGTNFAQRRLATAAEEP